VKKKSHKLWPNPFLTNFFDEIKGTANIWATSVAKIPAKVNKRPLSEFTPNLVTLVSTHLST
jgi:hypothetical protein